MPRIHDSSRDDLQDYIAYVGFDSDRAGKPNYFLCDNDADNVQIQEAIDYVNALGDGRVLMKPGAFDMAGLTTLKKGVDVFGCGKGITNLALSYNGDMFKAPSGSRLEYQRIGNFSMDGNKSVQTSGNGFDVYCYRTTFEYLHVHDFKNDGMIIGGDSNQGDNLVHSSFINLNDGDGIDIREYSHDTVIGPAVWIGNNLVGIMTRAGGIHIYDSHVWGTTVSGSRGIQVQGATSIQSCYIEKFGKQAIYINGSGNAVNHVRIKNNNIYGAGMDTNNTYDSILVDGTINQVSYAEITDNKFWSYETNKPRFHINETGTTTENTLLDNKYADYQTAPVKLTGLDDILDSVILKFTEPVVGAITTTSPIGVVVDATTEEAVLWDVIPRKVQQIPYIRIKGVALGGPISAGGQMHLELTFNAGASNFSYNTANKSWNLTNWDSEETDYEANDAVTWIVGEADVAYELRNLAAGDTIEIRARYEDGADPDGATNVVLRTAELVFV